MVERRTDVQFEKYVVCTNAITPSNRLEDQDDLSTVHPEAPKLHVTLEFRLFSDNSFGTVAKVDDSVVIDLGIREADSKEDAEKAMAKLVEQVTHDANAAITSALTVMFVKSNKNNS
tara:strand:- start:302 stop:652 length:351 start_codon:yes stop_codon:yes gene_type:complete